MLADKRKLPAGLDSIPSIFWANLTYLPATIIFNYSSKYNVLPSDWKCAAVTPPLKKR